MAEMVERVARAICRAIVEKDTAEAQFSYGSGPGYHEGRGRHAQLDIDIEGEIRDSWQEFIPVARAAIEAMREPTDNVGNALGEFLYGHPREKAVEWAKDDKFDSCRREGEEAWRKGIDAALYPPAERGK